MLYPEWGGRRAKGLVFLKNLDLVKINNSEHLESVCFGFKWKSGRDREELENNLHLFIQYSDSFWMMFLSFHSNNNNYNNNNINKQDYTWSPLFIKADKHNIPASVN